jgi:hypothetical protein
MAKVMTELEQLKKKCLKADGQPRKDATGPDLKRLKMLRDAEPLSRKELDEAQRRENEQKAKEVEDFKARKAAEKTAAATGQPIPQADLALDVPAVAPEHPRITALKQALFPLANLAVEESRPNDFILVNRGVAITAGDVRRAKALMGS